MTTSPTQAERLDAIEHDIATIKGIFEKHLNIPFIHPEQARFEDGQASAATGLYRPGDEDIVTAEDQA